MSRYGAFVLPDKKPPVNLSDRTNSRAATSGAQPGGPAADFLRTG
jgi:hypothetical protein